jgi:hypothetical protein
MVMINQVQMDIVQQMDIFPDIHLMELHLWLMIYILFDFGRPKDKPLFIIQRWKRLFEL